MDHGLKCSISYVYEWIQQISRKYVYLKLSKYVQVNFALRDGSLEKTKTLMVHNVQHIFHKTP